MKLKINELISLGFTEMEVRKMTIILPTLFGYSIDKIQTKINDMVNLGYKRDDVLCMIKTLPALIGSSIDSIKLKLDFYDSIGIKDLLITCPKKMIQSVELSYARYMYFKFSGKEIDESNSSLLFLDQKQFVRRFGLNSKELTDKYKYEDSEYVKTKKLCK